MLEGAVARILNQLLGKYVVDLDTENLNVGIFSGQVQLTDLKLKTEALYELDLPIEVIAGTIGKVWLQIPWGALWNQPVVVNIEDIHVIAGPIVNSDPFDPEKNKRLIRAFKKKALHDVSANTELIGGPNLFSEYLITNIVNNLQLNINNVHIRYDDFVSGPEPLVAGICIGNITAETTNNKWKASKNMKNTETCFYLVKIEALSVYWNPRHKPEKWDFPAQYYAWRNAMSTSLQNYCMNGEDFEFLIRPMTTKIKMTINKSKNGHITKLLNDIIIHDFNIQITKDQNDSILNVCNALTRMFISWEFLPHRPKQLIMENTRAWWKYAFYAAVDQRVKPYTWRNIKTVRDNYKSYMDLYKKILLNPNDTELKLDLQKYEDQLSVVNIVIARQQARLAVHSASLSEKSFWDILPSPERQLLCEKIGFNDDKEKILIDFNYNFRIGNSSLTLINRSKEVFVVTMTQFISYYQPNFIEDTYKINLKIEGIIVEGASVEDHLIPIISSDHNGHNCPAYFLKFELEKLPISSNANYRINCVLEYLELAYQKHAYEEVQNFFGSKYFSANNILTTLKIYPNKICNFLRNKLLDKWDFDLDIKLPYVVLPECGSTQKGETMLILDGGQLKLNTEICEETDVLEDATQMELEEQLYSRFHMEWIGCQVLFCDNTETWRESRKEKDTELHILPKTNFSAIYATCIKTMKTMPKHKLNITLPIIKLNISERKIISFLKFLNSFDNEMVSLNGINEICNVNIWKKDKFIGKLNKSYLLHVQNNIILFDKLIKNRRNKDKNGVLIIDNKKKSQDIQQKENMNEVWARCVDLPGLEDNISPNNTISTIFRLVVNELQLIYSRSSDSTDRQYMVLRLGVLAIDMAWMTFGPAYQFTLNSILLTDKLHTTPSGQYLDLIHSPIPAATDVLTILYRKVAANCPDFWTHFHGVETSLVADFGTIHTVLHQEAFHTIIKYTRYLNAKIRKCISPSISGKFVCLVEIARGIFTNKTIETPVPPGSVKFSHSARLSDLNIRICDSDFDIVNIHLSGLEIDFLFRANERFVFRSFLSNIDVEHLSEHTLYSKVLSTDEDKVFEVKYVRYASTKISDISPTNLDKNTDGSFKFNLGQIHATFLYKLVVQLNRFIVNLEAIPYLQKMYGHVDEFITKATDTLKASTKIHLAINLKGPVLLIPQKSSSPNVVIIDTGDLTVENFFKEYDNETVENILIKLDGITISRGVMLLTSTLEMQETIIEPVNLHLDIKRFQPHTKNSTKSLSWDIAGVMDTIEVTLGQRDLSIILSIYTENIGEGQILDLFPVVKTPTKLIEIDETVKSLEAFFCEPKQKDISVKLSFDSINLSLFFDAGELLSSPIRDLNHGLCKYQITDISTSFVVYTDRSIDGKLSVDTILIEEIGPDANAFDKGILQSPNDNKNNNCNITINKPPIIDITFHQTKTNDKSIDIIIGRLSLSLSVPFCEKLAMFIIECLPKDNQEIGIVNHGYVGELIEFIEMKNPQNSLTIAVRINKPEFIFIVETASSKKRYFITKTEILSDFSRHSNRQSLVISLSGLHTLFYDVGLNAIEPYTILKPCDIELSKTYNEEKGEKITATISSIYVQFCNRVVYSINDILNDISEHFKVPEVELTQKEVRKLQGCKSIEVDDLWEPKKVNEFVQKTEEDFVEAKNKVHEIFLLPKIEIVVILELEESPVIIFKSTIELTIYDWSSLLNCTCDLTIQANYFNESVQLWEPIIDPVVMDENVYKPWEVLVKIFQDKSQPILSNDNKLKKERIKKGSVSQSTTEDEDESGDDMIYLEPTNVFHNRNNRRVKTSLSTFLDDSDSENEDGGMEKLAAAISDLFTGDWNESEGSDCDHSSEGEEDSDENIKSKSNDSTQNELSPNYKKATYILIDAKNILNLTITPAFFKAFNEIFTMYSNKTLSIISNKKSINLINDIGPLSKIELFENRGIDDDVSAILMVSKTYEKEDSCPNSPSKSAYFINDEECIDDKDSTSDENLGPDSEMGFDYETINSLEFPPHTTTELYEKINKHHLKVHVPGFQILQTSCPKKSTQKLLRLNAISSNQIYYIIAKSCINKHGRNLVLSSPLQIRNETCFALSILYQPSVLQQLNLEPVGDVTNPFDTTMRIAVLEPHEQYNVPLYIAYHCKLFVQPAYAEGHYASDTGIWWRDLVTDLDTAHNFHCKPKSTSNLEVFSLRVMLKRNINLKKTHGAHTIPNYIIHLLPPLILHNFLPYTLTLENIELKQSMKVEPGEKNSLYSLNLSNDQKLLMKIGYLNSTWVGTLTLTPHLDEKVIVLCSDTKIDGSWTKQLAINVKAERDDSCNVYFYTPYWIVNKTGLPLHIKATSTNTTYGSNNEDVILFTYKRHGKQTLNLKVYESDWSNEFGLDCAGTTGLVVCKDNERRKRYSFLLSISLSQMCPRLTKVVTLMPSFLVANNTTRKLRFMEHNDKTDLWIDLQPEQCIPFWPETSSMQMYVRHRESKVASQPFFIANHHHTVLRMDKGSAISVNVTGGKTEAFKITFEEYKKGDAPIYVKNMCADLFLKIQQQGQSPVTLLSPYNGLIYTWDDPIKPRQLIWNVYNNKGPGFYVDILKDSYGEEKISFHSVTPGNTNTIVASNSSSEDSDSSDSAKTTLNKKVRRDKIIIYWLCFRDGIQKTLLFTQNQAVYNNILQTTFLETCDIECLVSLAGIGLSCFTKQCTKKEHVFVSLSDTPATWEVNVGHKWKTLTLELASWIEDKYRLHYKKCQLKDYIHIDFEKMFMLKPFFAELRRSYNPSIYIQLRKSLNYKYFNFKIQSMQIDNKQVGSNESVVLCPLPVESLKLSSPFIEFSFLKNTLVNCDLYKHIHMSVGDFYVNIQSNLITQIALQIAENWKTLVETTVLYRNDMSTVHAPINVIPKDILQRSIIENIYLSQTLIQLNILNKTQPSCTRIVHPITNILSYFFPYNISPYMPVEGVRHKVTPMEMTDMLETFSGGIGEIWEHFSSQFLQQYYAQVLGLQVLVNPYAIQAIPNGDKIPNDSEKMSSIILFGCRCLLGHSNMSSVALEQCILDVFANQSIENIQRIRRHGSYHNPSNIPKAITLSSKNFNPGVILALDQIIAKSQNAGLQCDGELFFRGTGKALISLVTRHPDDKSDNVQVAIEALRRASILGEPIKIHSRLTRYCNTYLGLKPFSIYESMGQYLLETLANGRFSNDSYWTHATVDKSGKSIIIVSLEHVLRVNKCRLWGPWELEWALDLDEIISVPKVTTTQLVFNVRQGENELNTDGKININGDKDMLKWLQEKIDQAIVVSMEEKSWTLTDN